jgi:hypothetical protein
MYQNWLRLGYDRACSGAGRKEAKYHLTSHEPVKFDIATTV